MPAQLGRCAMSVSTNQLPNESAPDYAASSSPLSHCCSRHNRNDWNIQEYIRNTICRLIIVDCVHRNPEKLWGGRRSPTSLKLRRAKVEHIGPRGRVSPRGCPKSESFFGSRTRRIVMEKKLINCVEHIGVEPMTSTLPAFFR
jgi:hypothetical protein